MGESKDVLLLEKFLAETITPDEEIRLREWADTTLSRPGTLDLLRASWSSAKVPDPSLDREARWSSLRQKIALPAGGTHVEDEAPWQHTRHHAATRHSWLATATRVPVVARVTCIAAVLLGIALVLAPQVRTAHNTSHQYAREYVTARGQRAVVRLPDGTMATLAPGTHLRLSVTGPMGARRVDLDGEAFFAVESNHTAPFVIHAGNTVTKVLGTEFGVRRYRSDSAVRVAVSSGRVAVQVTAPHTETKDKLSAHNDRDIVLGANEVARVTASGTVHVQRNADLTAELGWRTGHHLFRMVPAAVVAAELSRSYDLDIRIPDSTLGRQLLTVSFATAHESSMLDILVSALLDARMERHGRTVIISPITR